ncbi:MAG TPA: S8 family serine peptidase [Pyrinomonadaceae bacterium]|nr:S8 family serine peptidase [Pyrinomonadaceae bacterium]
MSSRFDSAVVKKGRTANRRLTRFFALSLLVLTASVLTRPGFARQGRTDDNLSPAGADVAKNPAYEKFDSRLSRVLEAWRVAGEGRTTRQEAEAVVAEVARASSLPAYEDRIEVWITYDGEPGEDEEKLLGAVAEKDDHYAVFGNHVQAVVRVESLEFIAGLPGVLQISIPPTGQPEVVSQGVSRTKASNFFNAGFNGQGVKVAILDLGFAGYTSRLGSELPSNVTARSFYNSTSGNGDITGGGEKHGTACAEVVHDMAPGAQLYLVNYNTVAEMNAAVQYLVSQGVRVISHSAGFFNSSFYDGGGPVSAVAGSARASGVLWVNSAGNSARAHWEGFFSDADGDDFNEFSGTTDETINVSATAGEDINVFLTWDDWNSSTNDYDLYLYFGSPLQVVASSAGFQTGFQEPTEAISYNAAQTGTYHIVIKRPFFASNLRFELFSSTHDLSEHNVLSTSVLDPACSASSFTAGAVRHDLNTVEPFSSLGPTTSGLRKPDIAGPDGVLTATYGSGGFFGTSASAPHVAGAAALILSQSPSKTASEVQSLLQSNAVDLGPFGADNIYGFGMLNLPAVATGITVGQGAPNPQLFVDAFNRNGLSQFVIMPPVNAVHRWNCATCSTTNTTWGKGLIQDFNDVDGFSHDALMLADTNTSFVALVYGGMWTKFTALGGVNYDAVNNRILGYPVADRNCSDNDATCFTDSQLISPFGTFYHYQRFQGGALVMHRSGAKNGQTYEVHGAIRAKWQELGGPGSGNYGLPVTDEYAWQGKRRSDFEGGSICFNPSTNQTEPGCPSTPPPVSVTVQTSPSGRSFTVDGVTFTAAKTFTWTSGTSHTVSTTSPQSGATGTRYVWAGWSDGGAVSHTVSPTSNATYTANFTTQHFLTTSAGSGGTVSPASKWVNGGQSVTVTATPNSGFGFAGWTGSGSGSFTGATNPVNVTMNGPVTETAGFTQNPIQVTVQTNPSGRTFTVDGTTFSAAQAFFWSPGSSHTIATTSPQGGGTGTQYVWGGWSDGGAISHTVSPTGGTTYTANFTKQYFLTTNAGGGGTVSPAGKWVNSGAAVSISATPSAGFTFAGWGGTGTGSYTGANNPAGVTMNGPVTETASFTQTNVTGGLQYYPLAHPVRLLDTRAGQTACHTPGVPLSANATRTQQAAGTCEGLVIPAAARAVVGNAAVVNNLAGSGAGFVTLYPSGVARPVAANVNYSPGQVVSNAFTVGLGADGAFNIYSFTKLDFVVDVTGYYAPPGQGGLYYHPLPKPVRLLDTRIGQTACDAPGSPIVGGNSRNESARTTCGGVVVPDDAKAVAGNVAVVNTLAGAGSGHVTLYPGGVARPATANVNYSPGQVVSNAFTVGLGSDGTFNIYAFTTLDVVVDVAGYYSASPAADANGMPGLLYYPLASPMRLLDTRAGQPACTNPGAPLAANGVRTQNARLTCGGLTVPASASAVVGNAAVVNTLTGSGAGHVILYPSGVARPLAANVNYTPGQIVSNAFTVGLGSDGAFNIYTLTALNFVADISGYFAP